MTNRFLLLWVGLCAFVLKLALCPFVASAHVFAPGDSTFSILDPQPLMEFFHIPFDDTKDLTLRVGYGQAHPVHGSKFQGTILFVAGKNSFIEKNSETLQILQHQGYDVWILDLVGQGGSTRLLNDNPHKTHIRDFADYEKSMDVFYRYVLEKTKEKALEAREKSGEKPEGDSRDASPRARLKPLILVGSSMGGHITLRYLVNHPNHFDGAIFMDPMLDFPTRPFPKWLARFLVFSGEALGLSEKYAPGQGDYNPDKGRFETNKLTQDPKRYARQGKYALTYPQYVTGGVTFGWVKAAFESVDWLLNKADFSKLQIPILMVTTGDDIYIDNTPVPAVVRKLKNVEHYHIENSRHHIFVESDLHKIPFWRRIGAFLKSHGLGAFQE